LSRQGELRESGLLAAVEDHEGETYLTLRIRWEGEACVLELHGELDLSTAPVLRDALDATAEAAVVEVILDMAGVRFADLAGMQPVLDAVAGAGGRGRTLLVRDAPPSVRRILALLPSDQRLDSPAGP
jgi:anti-sigma B factor antagonist